MNIVIVNCFDTYEHRVNLLHEVIKNEGHLVKIITSDFRHFEKTKRTEKREGFHFISAEPYQKNLSYQRLHSHSKLSKDIFEYLDSYVEDIDLIWILVPPNSFVKDAAKYKDKHKNVKVVFDLIDLWPETMPVGSIKKIFPFTIWKNLRDKYIQVADCVVTECGLYQEILKDVVNGIVTETLYLARPVTPYVPNVDLPKDKLSLCYLGSINNIIDIDVISNIIRMMAKKTPVELHIVGDGERKGELIKEAESAGAGVIFHGKVYDNTEKQRIFDTCHYGLNIMKKSVCVGLTMKSMDYLEFGLPLINNIHGDTWDFIRQHNLGINISEDLSDLINKDYDVVQRKNARDFFVNNLSLDQFREKVLRIINM